jgi:hypothetical protein
MSRSNPKAVMLGFWYDFFIPVPSSSRQFRCQNTHTVAGAYRNRAAIAHPENTDRLSPYMQTK